MTCLQLQRRLLRSSSILQILHLQYNAFIIYNESKAVPQRPSHDTVPGKDKQQTDRGKAHAET